MDYEKKNRRIIIVDDTASIHDDMCAILTYSESNHTLSELEESVLGRKSTPNASIHYEIDSSFQGKDGFERVENALEQGRPYALAIVGVRMPPGWDGIKTIEKMREIDPGLQIAICSAYSDYSWQSIHEKFGSNDWLMRFRKPFDLAEIQQFACFMTEKWNLAALASLKMDELETMVQEHARLLRNANAELAAQNASLADANQQLLREIEARGLADERIQYIAFHGSLTALPNRAFLKRLVPRELRPNLTILAPAIPRSACFTRFRSPPSSSTMASSVAWSMTSSAKPRFGPWSCSQKT